MTTHHGECSTVSVVADSIGANGVRLTTMQLRYPRFIHAEFMTHRVFSRNASSSRAIPVAKMLEQVRNDPAMPIRWGKNKPGMQAGEEVADATTAKNEWIGAAHSAAAVAEEMAEMGLHKQVANRVLEPFQWMHTIVTATEWGNFFALRISPMAQPEINDLATTMQQAMDASVPCKLSPGEAHLPYVSADERTAFGRLAMPISAARCARVSYANHDGSAPDPEKDYALAVRLRESHHMSPFEHPAFSRTKDDSEFYANLRGWMSLRAMYEA